MTTTATDIKMSNHFFRDDKRFFLLEEGRATGRLAKGFLRLYTASQEDLQNYSISTDGFGFHWDQIDENLSAFWMLNNSQQHNTRSK